jgi:hypothetical protein
MSVAEVLRARAREGEGAEGGAGQADRRAGQAQADHGEYISTLIKKKNKFSSYIGKFRVAKSNMRKGFQIYGEMRKYFPIYEEAVSHI